MVYSLTDKLHIVMYSRTLEIFDTGDGTHKQIHRCLSNSANPSSEMEGERQKKCKSSRKSSLSLYVVCLFRLCNIHHTIPRNAECHSLSLSLEEKKFIRSLPSVIIHSLSFPPSLTETKSDRHTFTCYVLILVHLFFSYFIRLFFQILFLLPFLSSSFDLIKEKLLFLHSILPPFILGLFCLRFPLMTTCKSLLLITFLLSLCCRLSSGNLPSSFLLSDLIFTH